MDQMADLRTCDACERQSPGTASFCYGCGARMPRASLLGSLGALLSLPFVLIALVVTSPVFWGLVAFVVLIKLAKCAWYL